MLQDLDRLCTKYIPLFDGFVLVAKKMDYRRKNDLSYYYRSEADYLRVKSFYTDYFTRDGWELTAQKDDGWGPRRIEFRKDDYQVEIYHGGMGDGVNYSIHCKKL